MDGCSDFGTMTDGTVAEQRMKARDGSKSSAEPSDRLTREVGASGYISSAVSGSLGSISRRWSSSGGSSVPQEVPIATGTVIDATKPSDYGVSSASSTTSSSVISTLASGAAGAIGAVGTAGLATASRRPGVGSYLGSGIGPPAGDVSSVLAVGLAAASLELIAACSQCCEVDKEKQPQEIGRLLDQVAAAQNIRDVAARLLEFWSILRGETLTEWSLKLQSDWVRSCYVVKYADPSKSSPGHLACALCGLLLELAAACRPTAAWWDTVRDNTFTESVRYLARIATERPPTVGWSFPQLAIRRQVVNTVATIRDDGTEIDIDDNSGKDAPKSDALSSSASCGLQRREEKGHAGRMTGAEVITMMAQGGKVRSAKHRSRSKEEPPSIASLYAGLEQVLAGDRALQDMSTSKGGRLFTQKTRPVRLLNQTSMAIKVCLFSENNFLCVVPVGGPGGSGVCVLEPGCRAQMRPTGGEERLKLKALTTGLNGRSLYIATVCRGQSVQLRSHDCIVEDVR